MVSRGEVWWFEPPHQKRRPVVILTRDEVIPHLNQLIALPITRVIRSIPTEVLLDPDDGMPAECVVATDNVVSIRPGFLTRRITQLGPARMAQVCRALRNAVAC